MNKITHLFIQNLARLIEIGNKYHEYKTFTNGHHKYFCCDNQIMCRHISKLNYFRVLLFLKYRAHVNICDQSSSYILLPLIIYFKKYVAHLAYCLVDTLAKFSQFCHHYRIQAESRFYQMKYSILLIHVMLQKTSGLSVTDLCEIILMPSYQVISIKNTLNIFLLKYLFLVLTSPNVA